MKNSRIKRMQYHMKRRSVQLVLLFNLESLKPKPNYLYMSGFSGQGALAVTQRTVRLLVPEPEYPIARREIRGTEVINFGSRMIPAIRRLYRKQLLGRVGLDFSSLSASQLVLLKKSLRPKGVIDITAALHTLRSVKTHAEVSYIRKSCAIAEEIINKAVRRRRYRTESDLASYLISETYRKGLRPAFDPIVASGRNSGKWHHITSKKVIGSGFIIIDYGVKYKGYCSDITRTFYKGKPSAREAEVYDLVRDVQEECIRMVAPGADYREIHKHAAKRLGRYFNHGIGHGIGLYEHESPFVGEGLLKEGMVLTIEPGLYIPYRYGARVEDDILVTKNGYELLSSGRNKLVVIR